MTCSICGEYVNYEINVYGESGFVYDEDPRRVCIKCLYERKIKVVDSD